MLEPIAGLPDGVVGIRATGKVSADDYRSVFVEAMDRALEHSDKVRLLYELGEDYEGYDVGGLWQDLRLGASHFNSFERVAVVTDLDWIQHAVRVFGVLIPGEVRAFGLDERDAATDWVVGSEASRT
jgi:SpoIIAA-like